MNDEPLLPGSEDFFFCECVNFLREILRSCSKLNFFHISCFQNNHYCLMLYMYQEAHVHVDMEKWLEEIDFGSALKAYLMNR